jgi:hypothetical protein
MSKAYLLVYSDEIGTREQVKHYINNIREITHWRFDLPNTFYLISLYDSNYLSNKLMGFVGKNKKFIITEINTGNSQGVLTPESWFLLNNKSYMPGS